MKITRKYKIIFIILCVALMLGFLYLLSKATLTFFIDSLSLENINYVNLNVSDMFELVILGAFIYATLIAIPVIFLIIYNKYKSGLYKKERKIFKIIMSLYPLSLLGAAVGYIISTRYIIMFFLKYNSSFGLQNNTMLINIIKLIWTTMLTFAILIHVPTLLILLKKGGIISKQKMKTYRIFFFMFSLLVGAILSPPDGLSMLIFGIPIYLGYELSIWV